MPNFEDILAEADRDVDTALAGLQSPRPRYTPTGRTVSLLPDTAVLLPRFVTDCQTVPRFCTVCCLVFMLMLLFVEPACSVTG